MSKRSYYINIDLPAPNEDSANFTSFRVDFVPGTSLPEVEKAYSEIGQWLAAMAHISEGTKATVKAPAEAPAEAPDLTLVENSEVPEDAPVAEEEKKKKKKRRSPAQMEAARKAAANGVDPEPATPEEVDPFGDDAPKSSGHHGSPPPLDDLIAAAKDWLGGDGSTEALRILLKSHGAEKLRDLPEGERAGVMAKFLETA